MSSLIKGISNVVQHIDPIAYGASKIQANNPNNRVVSTLLPGAAQTARLNSGEGVNLQMAGDPGQLFTKTKTEKDKLIADAKAAAIPMPLANEQELALARRRASALQMQQGSRASTILTGTTDSLGG